MTAPAETEVDPRSDEALLAAYGRSGEEAALEALVRRRWAEAYRTALRALGDPAAAEDAAQETFVAAARAARGFRPGSARAWLGTLLVNAIRMAGRARGRRTRHEERAAASRSRREGPGGAAGADGRAVAGPAVEADPAERLLAEEIEGHVRRLPLDERVAVVLRFYEGRGHDEVAAALGCPSGTASSRIRRGLEQLKQSLSLAGYAAAATARIDPLVARLESVATAGVARTPPPPPDLLPALPVDPPRPPRASHLAARAARLAARAALVKALATVIAPLVVGGALAYLLMAGGPGERRPREAPGLVAAAPRGAETPQPTPPADVPETTPPAPPPAAARAPRPPSETAAAPAAPAPAADIEIDLFAEHGRKLDDVAAEIAEKAGVRIRVECDGDVDLRLIRLPWRLVLDLVARDADCEVEERGPRELALVRAPRVDFGREGVQGADAAGLLTRISSELKVPLEVEGALPGPWVSAVLRGDDWRDAAATIAFAASATAVASEEGSVIVRPSREPIAPARAEPQPASPAAPSAVTFLALVKEEPDVRVALRRIVDATGINLYVPRPARTLAERNAGRLPWQRFVGGDENGRIPLVQRHPRLFVVEAMPRVSMEFADADVRVVLDLLGRQAGRGFVFDGRVSGPVCIHIRNAPYADVVRSIAVALDLEAGFTRSAFAVRRALREEADEPADAPRSRGRRADGADPSDAAPDAGLRVLEVGEVHSKGGGLPVVLEAGLKFAADADTYGIDSREEVLDLARTIDAVIDEPLPRFYLLRRPGPAPEAFRGEARLLVDALALAGEVDYVMHTGFGGKAILRWRTASPEELIREVVEASGEWRVVHDPGPILRIAPRPREEAK